MEYANFIIEFAINSVIVLGLIAHSEFSRRSIIVRKIK